MQIEADRQRRDHQQRRQRRRNGFGQAREQHHHRNRQRHQAVHQRALPGDHLQLRQHDDDRQTVDEAVDRRQRHQTNELAQPKGADQDLNPPGKQRGPQYVTHAVLRRQAH